MVGSLPNLVSNPELRKRLLITLCALAAYRVLYFVEIPGLLTVQTRAFFGDELWIADLFVSDYPLSLLGLGPFMTAAFIVQIWTAFRRGSEGAGNAEFRAALLRKSRYLAAGLAVFQAISIAGVIQQSGLARSPGLGFTAQTVLALTAGAFFIIWIADLITERGLGNGVALLFFCDLAPGFLSLVELIYQNTLVTGDWNLFDLSRVTPAQHYSTFALAIALVLAFVAFVVAFERGVRRIPVEIESPGSYRSVSLEVRLNSIGVWPAAVVLSGLDAIFMGLEVTSGEPVMTDGPYSYGTPFYYLILSISIVLFAFAYTALVSRPTSIAQHLHLIDRESQTRYLDRIITRTAWMNAAYLAFVLVVPSLLVTGLRMQEVPWAAEWSKLNLPDWFLNGLIPTEYVSGASLLVMVAVILDLFQLDSSEPANVEYTHIATPHTMPKVLAAKALLEAAGINSIVKNERLQDLFGPGRIGTGYNVFVGPPILYMQPERAEEAAVLLTGSLTAPLA